MSNRNPNPATRFSANRQPANTGRPKEARDRITKTALYALAADFEKHGVAAIKRVREESPERYLFACLSVIPKEIEVTRTFDDVSDETLREAIDAIKQALHAQAMVAAEEEQPGTLKTVN